MKWHYFFLIQPLYFVMLGQTFFFENLEQQIFLLLNTMYILGYTRFTFVTAISIIKLANIQKTFHDFIDLI